MEIKLIKYSWQIDNDDLKLKTNKFCICVFYVKLSS